MLAWACSVYEGDVPHVDGGSGNAGSGVETAAGTAGASGDAGAGGGSIAGSGGETGDTTSGPGGGSTGAAGGDGGASGASVGTAGGSGGRVGSSGGAGSSGGKGGSGGTQGGAAGTLEAGAKDQASDPIVEPTVDASVDSGCPNPTLCDLKAQLLHRYTFNGTGTTVTDSVGTAHGTVMNAQLSGSGTVVLVSGATEQYVDLPNGIIKSLTNATFEVWVTWSGGAGWQRIFDFGDSDMGEGMRGAALTSLYLTPQAMVVPSFPGPPVMLAGFKRAAQMADQVRSLSSIALPTGAMVEIAVVVDATNHILSLYRNGAFESSVAFTDSLSTVNDINVWLGRSQWSADPAFSGTLHEFRIYGAALSLTSINASSLAGPDPAFLN
jgi:hypothetical protein